MGLHQRYAEWLQSHEPTMVLAKADEDKIRQELTSRFDSMMKTLFSQKGASFSIGIMAEPEVQDFINTHASVLDSSFRKVEMSDAMRRRLTRSDYIFSGMKTFHELNEAFPSQLDENGNRKSFEAFLDDVRKIDETYNSNYLRAEYNFVQSSATMAAKWEEFAEDGDRYNLQYRTAGDSRVRPAHAELNGITLPMSDSFWEEYYPPNGWNCRCTVVQVRKSKYPETPHDEAMALGESALQTDTKGVFRFNAGKEQKTMPDYNPYTIRRCKDCDIAKDDLKLAKKYIPDNELCEACKLLRTYKKALVKSRDIRKDPEIKKLQGTTVTNSDFHHEVLITGRTLREWTNQPHKHFMEKNRLLYDIRRVFSEAAYIGSTTYDKSVDVRLSHIFEVSIAGEPSWIIVREYSSGEFMLHSVSDGAKLAEIVKKERNDI